MGKMSSKGSRPMCLLQGTVGPIGPRTRACCVKYEREECQRINMECGVLQLLVAWPFSREGSQVVSASISKCANDLAGCVSCRLWERHPECGQTYFRMAEDDGLLKIRSLSLITCSGISHSASRNQHPSGSKVGTSCSCWSSALQSRMLTHL